MELEIRLTFSRKSSVSALRRKSYLETEWPDKNLCGCCAIMTPNKGVGSSPALAAEALRIFVLSIQGSNYYQVLLRKPILVYSPSSGGS